MEDLKVFGKLICLSDNFANMILYYTWLEEVKRLTYEVWRVWSK